MIGLARNESPRASLFLAAAAPGSARAVRLGLRRIKLTSSPVG